MAAEKVTFTLPADLVRRIEREPAGQRSRLVADALRRELDRRAASEALRRLRRTVAWRGEDHPDLLDPVDFSRYRPARSRTTG